MVSFAPENLLTLLSPGFFGDMTTVPTGAAGICGKCACSSASADCRWPSMARRVAVGISDVYWFH